MTTDTPTVPINGKIAPGADAVQLNREQRREMRRRAADRVKDAKAFILVTFDGSGIPTHAYDVRCCDNREDVRHIMLQGVAKYVEDQTTAIRVIAEKVMARLDEEKKVEAAKEKRSEELRPLSEESETIKTVEENSVITEEMKGDEPSKED